MSSRVFAIFAFALAAGSAACGAGLSLAYAAPEAALEALNESDPWQEIDEMVQETKPAPLPDWLDSMISLSGTQETWLEGDTVRFVLASALESGELGRLAPLVENLRGVRILRQNSRLVVMIHYPSAFKLKIREFNEAPNWQLYSIRVPELSIFTIKMTDGQIRLASHSGPGAEKWQLKTKNPMLPDSVYMSRASLDLVTGDARVQAGFLGDFISIVARLRVSESAIQFKNIGLWDSMLDNIVFNAEAFFSELPQSGPAALTWTN